MRALLRLTALLLPVLCLALSAPVQAAGSSKTNIRIPTAATTGALYPLGAGIANVWNSRLEGVQVSVQASNGGLQNLDLLKKKEAEVSFAVSSIAYEAAHGLNTFKDRAYPDLRVLAGLYYNPNQVVARRDSKLTALPDFKGRRFSPGSAGGTTDGEANVHFSAAGLKYPDDLQIQRMGFTESIDLMRNKQIDGAWIMAGIPTAAVTEMCATANGELIALDEALIKEVQTLYPWYSSYVIPAGTYDGQDTDISTTAVKMLLLTDKSLPEELVYSLTKSFWENLEEISAAHAVMKSVTPDMAVKDLSSLPLHPGAARYYREVGLLK